ASTPTATVPAATQTQPDVSAPPGPGIQVGPPLPADQGQSGTAPGGQVDVGKESKPAWWDIPGRVRYGIDAWFRGLVTDALNPMLDLVGKTVLATPQVAGQGEVGQIWLISLALADGLLVLFLLAAGALLMSNETLHSRYALKDALPRIVIGAVAANASLSLSHALPQTDGLARMWWRGMSAALGVQVAQALVLATAVRVFFNSGGRQALGLSVTGNLIDLLVCLCLFWILIRIPFWAKDLA